MCGRGSPLWDGGERGGRPHVGGWRREDPYGRGRVEGYPPSGVRRSEVLPMPGVVRETHALGLS